MTDGPWQVPFDRLVRSMGRIGAAGDNAAMESFFSLLQKNVLDRQLWAIREDLVSSSRRARSSVHCRRSGATSTRTATATASPNAAPSPAA